MKKRVLFVVGGLLALSVVSYFVWKKITSGEITKQQKEDRDIKIVRN